MILKGADGPSVTDCPYLSPAGPMEGMSCRPSTRLDSSMVPMISEAVSEPSVSSCLAWKNVHVELLHKKETITHNVIGDLDLLFVLLLGVSVAAVDLVVVHR